MWSCLAPEFSPYVGRRRARGVPPRGRSRFFAFGILQAATVGKRTQFLLLCNVTEGCGRQTAYLFMALETIREALHHAHQGGRLPCSLFGLNWVEEATKRCAGPTRLRLALWAELLQRKARQWSVAHARTRTRVVVKGRLPNYVPVCAAGPK